MIAGSFLLNKGGALFEVCVDYTANVGTDSATLQANDWLLGCRVNEIDACPSVSLCAGSLLGTVSSGEDFSFHIAVLSAPGLGVELGIVVSNASLKFQMFEGYLLRTGNKPHGKGGKEGSEQEFAVHGTYL